MIFYEAPNFCRSGRADCVCVSYFKSRAARLLSGERQPGLTSNRVPSLKIVAAPPKNKKKNNDFVSNL
jgi:hypothetical protein